jgi:hypothetical protein
MFKLTRKQIRMIVGLGMFVCFMHIVGIAGLSISLFQEVGFVGLYLMYFTQAAFFYIVLSYYVLTRLIPYEASK